MGFVEGAVWITGIIMTGIVALFWAVAWAARNKDQD